MAYEALFGGLVVVASGGLAGAGFKFWRDSARHEEKLNATKTLADQTARLLAAHQADCNTKNVTIARLDERVTAIQASQTEIRKTVDKIDGKLDHLLEKS